MIKPLLLLCILLASTAASFGQASVEELDASLKADLTAGPCKNEDRQAAVKELFKKHGAADADIQVEKYKDADDVFLTKKGKTDDIVVLGAHYDKVKDGCGILDNWSGVVIMAQIYELLAKVETQKTIKFVAFGNEEMGLRGSNAMVKAIPKNDRPK